MFDLIGIGAGPNNLSLAALSSNIPNMNSLFLEKESCIKWHHGMMIDNCTLQNSITKDLVTMADPTNKYSLLNYLHSKKRIYEFISSGTKRILREEYDNYLNWVAEKVGNIKYNCSAYSLSDKGDYFLVETDHGEFTSKNVCIAIGRSPNSPFKIAGDLENKIIHSSQYAYNKAIYENKKIAIIGGGQSAAEIFYDLVNTINPPSEVHWITRRENLNNINESCFDNELFTPFYVKYFRELDKSKRKNLLGKQILSSDGINPELLQDIYQLLYKNRFLRNEKIKIKIYLSHEVYDIANSENKDRVEVLFRSMNENLSKKFSCEKVISCTGYKQSEIPNLIKRLDIDLDEDGDLIYENDYSIYKNKSGKVFVVNAGIHKYGVNDPNISLAAWRASKIINAINNYEYYVTPQDGSFIL